MKSSSPVWALVLLVGSAILSPLAQSAATAAGEGRVYAYDAGQDYSWNPSAGPYLLNLRSGPQGAEIDVSGLQTNNPPTERLTPSSPGVTFAVDFDGTHSKGIHVKSGTGAVVLARQDLETRPLSDFNADLQATGTLDRYTCRAYFFTAAHMTQPYLLGASGSGVQFRVYDPDLAPLQGPSDSLAATIDPNKPETIQVTAQACREAEGAGAYRVFVTYPAPGTHLGGSSTPIAGWIVGGIALALLVVFSVVWFRRRRRPFDRIR